MVATQERIPPDDKKVAEDTIRAIWRQFYQHGIDEPTRIQQLGNAFDSFPPSVQDWLLEPVNSGATRYRNRTMRLAEEELRKGTQSTSRGEKRFVRREKAKIRKE